MGTIAFYIAKAGAPPDQCIQGWRKQGIFIEALGFDGRWGECRYLVVPAGTRIRITYQHEGDERVEVVVFPADMAPVASRGLSSNIRTRFTQL
jgi:hypothetical protein